MGRLFHYPNIVPRDFLRVIKVLWQFIMYSLALYMLATLDCHCIFFFLVHNVVKPGVCHLAEPHEFLDLLDLYSSCSCVFFLHNIGSIYDLLSFTCEGLLFKSFNRWGGKEPGSCLENS